MAYFFIYRVDAKQCNKLACNLPSFEESFLLHASGSIAQSNILVESRHDLVPEICLEAVTRIRPCRALRGTRSLIGK